MMLKRLQNVKEYLEDIDSYLYLKCDVLTEQISSVWKSIHVMLCFYYI